MYSRSLLVELNLIIHLIEPTDSFLFYGTDKKLNVCLLQPKEKMEENLINSLIYYLNFKVTEQYSNIKENQCGYNRTDKNK